MIPCLPPVAAMHTNSPLTSSYRLSSSGSVSRSSAVRNFSGVALAMGISPTQPFDARARESLQEGGHDAGQQFSTQSWSLTWKAGRHQKALDLLQMVPLVQADEASPVREPHDAEALVLPA